MGLSITARVWRGIVMMKMTKSTEITSINGVMLISEQDPPGYVVIRSFCRRTAVCYYAGYGPHAHPDPQVS